MANLFKRLLKGESGQALAVVLALLALGSLAVVPSINYAATNLNATRMVDNNVSGIYAADAGIEAVLWGLTANTTLPTELTEDINNMDVTMETEDLGYYTIVFGELVEAEGHSYYLGVEGDIEPVGGNVYQYTITVTWQPGSGLETIHLTDIGVSLPTGYEYVDESAAGFGDNLSTDEPEESGEAGSPWMLNWELGPPYPTVTDTEPVATQTFYVQGSGDLEGDYTWVVANRNDIDEVGELTGNLYLITATAVRNGETVARIAADVLMVGDDPNIISWQISK